MTRDGRWTTVFRLAWWLGAPTVLLMGSLAVPARVAHLYSDPYGLAAAYEATGISVRFFAVYFTAVESLFALVFVLAGIFIFWRRSAEWLAILVSLALMFQGIATPLVDALAVDQPIWRWPILVARIVGYNLVVLMLFLFPNGRFVPRATRWLAGVWLLYTVAWLRFPDWRPPSAILAEATQPGAWRPYLAPFIVVAVGVASQAYRYRAVSGQSARQQTKWVVAAVMAWLGLTLVIVGPFAAFDVLRAPTPQALRYILAAGPLLLLGIFLIPLSLAISILRYRLWDIDLIIRRTLTYTVVTGLLTSAYLGGVVLLQRGFGHLAGEMPALGIVVSTLAIVALFNPLRRRVQAVIDRRFFRQKVDAARALAAFAVTARDETDLDRLTDGLLGVVQTTMAPERLTLWLKADPPAERTSHAP